MWALWMLAGAACATPPCILIGALLVRTLDVVVDADEAFENTYRRRREDQEAP